MNRVLIFGDSIVQGFHDSQGGWADRLKRELLAASRHNSVFNLGISGDTVSHVWQRFASEVEVRTKRWDSPEQTIIILAVGANDTYKTATGSEPKTPLGGFIETYAAILEAATTNAKDVIVCSLLPVDETRSVPVSWQDISYTNKDIEKYNRKLEELCVQQGVIFIDMYNFATAIDWNSMLDDGVYPNDMGHEWLFEKVKPEILKLIMQ